MSVSYWLSGRYTENSDVSLGSHSILMLNSCSSSSMRFNEFFFSFFSFLQHLLLIHFQRFVHSRLILVPQHSQFALPYLARIPQLFLISAAAGDSDFYAVHGSDDFSAVCTLTLQGTSSDFGQLLLELVLFRNFESELLHGYGKYLFEFGNLEEEVLVLVG